MNIFERNRQWLKLKKAEYHYQVIVPEGYCPRPHWYRAVTCNKVPFIATLSSVHERVWGFKTAQDCEAFTLMIAWYGGTYVCDFD